MKEKINPSSLLTQLKTLPIRTRRFLLKASFEKKYLAGALAVLLGTTMLWSLLSNGVHIHNSDQLVDPYLFNDPSTLNTSTFPGQHSFLIKWPLFWLVRLFDYSGWAFATVNTLAAVITVGSLAYFISRIEKRAMYRGTLFLCLASMLLLVPAEPYAGAILPLNMAMLATRNLEYVLYIIAIYGLIRSPKLRSRGFWLWAGLLTLLVASDKLFLGLGLGGAILALIAYSLAGKWKLADTAVRWLLASIVAGVGATTLIHLINKAKITHIVGAVGSGPYDLIHSVHSLTSGSIYAVLGLFTNFGANPAYDNIAIKHLPAQAILRTFGWLGPALILNFIFLCFGLYLIWLLMRASLSTQPRNKWRWDDYPKLAVSLIWSTVAAIGLYALTDHYWPVDSRYLTIALFSVFISVAVVLRRYTWTTNTLAKTGGLLIIVMIIALPGVFHTYAAENKAQEDIVNRNSDIAQVLKRHEVDVLVGDYWRVFPIKQVGGSKQAVMPLTNCTLPRADLASSLWNYDLSKHSFAYLLTLSGGNLTNYPSCTLDSVLKTYGRPNTSAVIAGTQSAPNELLLFYDKGIRKSSPVLNSSSLASILPITLDELPYTSCPNGTTIMNVVAHQDDDLLFINPDTQNAVASGHCVRTIYVTAGDAGSDRFYWLSREQGSETAYSNMLKGNAVWISRVVKIGANQFVQVSHPRNDYRASLIFMHLPDGNTTGGGFRQHSYESLAGLESGRISSIRSVDNQSVYSLSQLTSSIAALMRVYQPVEVRTQANYFSKEFPDHSDHMAVGKIVKKSLVQYESSQFENNAQIPLKYYVGYPIHGMPPNVSGEDLSNKKATWYSYAIFDSSVCRNDQNCSNTAYKYYLKGQYQANN